MTTTTIMATTAATVVPIITIATPTAIARTATATSVGTDDELGPVPIMIQYIRILQLIC